MQSGGRESCRPSFRWSEGSRRLILGAAMQLIEILLPLADNEGKPFPGGLHARVRDELADRFGGVTAFTRAPAEGLWKAGEGEARSDQIVIFEVMADWLDRGWWSAYRIELERRFRQEEIMVRAGEVELL
jgi:hypothetical protein